MAPIKKTSSTSNRSVSKDAVAAIATLLPIARKGSKNIQDQNMDVMKTRAKRKADNHSPIKNENVKRSALGNLTNNTTQHSEEDVKNKQPLGKKTTDFGFSKVLKDTTNFESNNNDARKALPTKITTRAAAKKAGAIPKQIVDIENAQTVGRLPAQQILPPPAPILVNNTMALMPSKAAHKSTRRISNEFNQTEDSLYMSALEDVSSCESMRLSGNFEASKRRSVLLQQQQHEQEQEKPLKENAHIKIEKDADDSFSTECKCEVQENDGRYIDKLSPLIKPVPEGVDDFDKANWNDPLQASPYAMDIFNYLQSREKKFIIDDYMIRQVYLSKWMRSLLVDWMVEVQETFELNHETLYLAVKIVDLFLCKVVINKERLQLVGAAALFIACKYDERTPPLIEDFLYICDGAYKHDELVKMEMTVLRTIDYDLGIPISYRFLRRYARCARVTMPTLTLARYVLELSLMDYEAISLSDSRLACAALFIALRLHGAEKAWSPTLEYYSNFKLVEFAEIIPILNANLHRKPKGAIKNIRNKYSHIIFHEVAKVKLLSTEQLFEHELDLKFTKISNSEEDVIKIAKSKT